MLIQMQAIERVYRKGSVTIQALQVDELSIAESEFVAIMGPSGSGKSTLLHLLGCLDRPSSGTYLLDGIAVSDLDDTQLSQIRNQKIGFVFQAFNLLAQHSVLRNIEAPLLYSNAASDKSSLSSLRRARKLAELVGLEQRLHHRPSELSGGEMQRVALARALITRPRVILADEPTGNLDSRTGQDIMRILHELHAQGRTIIVVTHEQSIAGYAERIIYLKDGAIERENRKSVSHPFSTKMKNSPPDVEQSRDAVSHENGTTNLLSDSLYLSAYYHRIVSLLYTAIQGLLLHKLRSLLSILGIVFGIGAFIAMLAIGAGARQEILEQITLLGTDTIFVKAFSEAEEHIHRGREQLSQGLTLDDATRIFQISPFIKCIAAMREFTFPVQYQQRMTRARILATTSEYQHTAKVSLEQGRFLTAADEQEGQRVCVLGTGIRQTLFAFQNPLGEMIKIQNDWFRVIGVLENKTLNSKNSSAIQVRDINMCIYIPLAASALFIAAEEREQVHEIAIQMNTAAQVTEAARLIRTVLARAHHGAEDYEVIVPRELLKQSQQTQRIFNTVMGSIAGISLLVGGIGIMNIMLATVAERTREIGIRRAIGASRRKILQQFLIETLVLTLIGGCLGILLGAGGAALISLLAGWRTSISLRTVLFAVGISAGVGLVFGMYPAAQGAAMDPIRALRYE
ncbi:MAG: ABC transporter permease [Candidatus Vecturithrix sp.]|jgi:macrolide transport system ATP-binding/permease protein|nr:ABC transporter permease [Candidatus Vecturithrix sp.]